MSDRQRTRFVRVEAIVATLCILAGILLGTVVAALGIAVWFLGAVALGHALAIHVGFADGPVRRDARDDH